jgi:hypothetical protein
MPREWSGRPAGSASGSPSAADTAKPDAHSAEKPACSASLAVNPSQTPGAYTRPCSVRPLKVIVTSTLRFVLRNAFRI